MPAARTNDTRVALVVADDPDVLQIGILTFEALGYQVCSAQTGAGALAVLAREPIDVLLSDVLMPGMTGVELAARAKAFAPDLRVVLVSGYPRSALESAGLDSTMRFLSKPYRWSDLQAALEEP